MIDWIDKHQVGIVFSLSLVVIGLIIAIRRNPSYKKNWMLVGTYALLLVTGLGLLGMTTMKAVPHLMELSPANTNMGSNVSSILMLAVYMFTLVVGFKASARFLIFDAVESEKVRKSANVVLYLWTFPLLLVAVALAKKYGSIPVYVYLLLIIGLVLRNCMLMKSHWKTALLVALLGIIASIALTYVFINISIQLTIIVIIGYFIRYMFTRQGMSSLLSDHTDYSRRGIFGGSSYDGSGNERHDDGYDTTIHGGGIFGEDVRASRNADGSLTDENGGRWSSDGYGNYTKND